SHVQGSDVVASLVVFEDGLARKSDYRRFEVRGGAAGGDVAAIAEVTRRRFRRHVAENGSAENGSPQNGSAENGSAENGSGGNGGAGAGDTAGIEPATSTDPADGPAAADTADPVTGHPAPRPGIDPTTGRPRRFAYPPNLFVVDGGPAQVEAAADVLADLGVTDVAVCGLAKRLEEVWLPADPDPVILSRTSEGLYLLQRVRDEAHRFAITYHRQRRSKGMTVSALDGVPGLGPSRRAALLKHFGSVRKLRAAGVDEIAALPGFGTRTATAVLAALNATDGDPAGSTAGSTAPAGTPRTEEKA
ncbi:MAG TPA: helix-hairpin-helix domain-containing protein, partial [Pseudonocardia sp.]